MNDQIKLVKKIMEKSEYRNYFKNRGTAVLCLNRFYHWLADIKGVVRPDLVHAGAEVVAPGLCNIGADGGCGLALFGQMKGGGGGSKGEDDGGRGGHGQIMP